MFTACQETKTLPQSKQEGVSADIPPHCSSPTLSPNSLLHSLLLLITTLLPQALASNTLFSALSPQMQLSQAP